MRTALGLAALSSGITAYQLALMQVLNYLQGHHFAFLVVALAVLGFGASGTLLAFVGHARLSNLEKHLSWCAVLCFLGTMWAVPIGQLPWFRCDFQLIFTDFRLAIRFIAAGLIFLAPFFAGACGIGLVLTLYPERSGFFYSANMIGSGFGGLVGLFVIGMFPPHHLSASVAVLPLLAAFLLPGPLLGVPCSRHLRLLLSLLLILLWGLSAYKAPRLVPSEFKAVSQALNLPDARIVEAIPGIHGYLQRVSSEYLRSSPPSSLTFSGDAPRIDAIFLNGEPAAHVAVDEAKEEVVLYDYTTEILPFLVASPQSVLLLEPRNVDPVVQAAAHGSSDVRIILSNPAILAYLERAARDSSPKRHWDAAIETVQGHPRHFLDRSKTQFDLIRFPTVGSISEHGGMSALREDYLFTMEAIGAAWRALTPSGQIVLTSALTYPPRHSLRLLATIMEGLAIIGIPDPEHHVIAIRGWSAATYLVSRKPIAAEEAETIMAACIRLEFDPLILGARTITPDEPIHEFSDPSFPAIVEALLTSDRNAVYRDYALNIRPPTDDRPYFSQFVRWSRIKTLIGAFGTLRTTFFEMGTSIVILTTILLIAFSAVLILVPLYRLSAGSGGKPETLCYFGALGFGFMLIEIGLMQRLTLAFSAPLLAIGLVLPGLLILSGFGSLRSAPLPAHGMARASVCFSVAILAAFLGATAMMILGQSPDGLNFLSVILIGSLLCLMVFLMGIPFPLGIRALGTSRHDQLPWAWGINGCLSVIGPPCAILIAIHFGISTVFYAGAVTYGVAALSALRMPWRIENR